MPDLELGKLRGEERRAPLTDLIHVERKGEVTIVTINRPEVRNAVNPSTAKLLADAFIAFDEDETSSVAVFDGAQGTFCAGADLKAVAEADMATAYRELTPPVPRDGRGPMGPSYLRLSKPVIAAVAGHAVAGGLELSLWCDLRIVEEDAVFGVYCRRWGVPLIDGGTVRLPRIVGHGHAMDMILTGRPVHAEEARMMGLANKVVPKGTARQEAIALAEQLSRFPRTACATIERRPMSSGISISTRPWPTSPDAGCLRFAPRRPSLEPPASSRDAAAPVASTISSIPSVRAVPVEEAFEDEDDHGLLVPPPTRLGPAPHQQGGHHEAELTGEHRTGADRRHDPFVDAPPHGRVQRVVDHAPPLVDELQNSTLVERAFDVGIDEKAAIAVAIRASPEPVPNEAENARARIAVEQIPSDARLDDGVEVVPK